MDATKTVGASAAAAASSLPIQCTVVASSLLQRPTERDDEKLRRGQSKALKQGPVGLPQAPPVPDLSPVATAQWGPASPIEAVEPATGRPHSTVARAFRMGAPAPLASWQDWQDDTASPSSDCALTSGGGPGVREIASSEQRCKQQPGPHNNPDLDSLVANERGRRSASGGLVCCPLPGGQLWRKTTRRLRLLGTRQLDSGQHHHHQSAAHEAQGLAEGSRLRGTRKKSLSSSLSSSRRSKRYLYSHSLAARWLGLGNVHKRRQCRNQAKTDATNLEKKKKEGPRQSWRLLTVASAGGKPQELPEALPRAEQQQQRQELGALAPQPTKVNVNVSAHVPWRGRRRCKSADASAVPLELELEGPFKAGPDASCDGKPARKGGTGRRGKSCLGSRGCRLGSTASSWSQKLRIDLDLVRRTSREGYAGPLLGPLGSLQSATKFKDATGGRGPQRRAFGKPKGSPSSRVGAQFHLLAALHICGPNSTRRKWDDDLALRRCLEEGLLKVQVRTSARPTERRDGERVYKYTHSTRKFSRRRPSRCRNKLFRLHWRLAPSTAKCEGAPLGETGTVAGD